MEAANLSVVTRCDQLLGALTFVYTSATEARHRQRETAAMRDDIVFEISARIENARSLFELADQTDLEQVVHNDVSVEKRSASSTSQILRDSGIIDAPRTAIG